VITLARAGPIAAISRKKSRNATAVRITARPATAARTLRRRQRARPGQRCQRCIDDGSECQACSGYANGAEPAQLPAGDQRPDGVAHGNEQHLRDRPASTPAGTAPGQQRHPRQPGQQPGPPGDRQPVAAARQPREHCHDDRHRSDQQAAQGAWLAGRDRHSARKTKMPQIRNQGSQRYACHSRARRSAWAAALITPAWTSSPLAVRTRP
jgi:hypothetical protein